ncbi:MAG: CBS domain-containing protein [Alphaproteobacteria bacterium]|nr:CBS domain-containing protein [Alphaproteobacteria bacterium]
MLKSVLDLDEVEVYDVMNHRKNLFSINVELPTEEIVKKIKDCPFSRIPLYKNKPDNIVGVIRVRHLLQECVDKNNNFSKIKIAELMSKPWFIPDNTTLIQQLQLFQARREHFAFVVDEYGDLQGIVTLEDILEEIVGDINDESDISSLDIMGIRKIGEKTYLVDGQVPIRDLNRKFDWNISDENAATIAGYLLDMTQSIPEQGQKFVFGDFEFEIIKRNKNQISQIKISKIENQPTLQ